MHTNTFENLKNSFQKELSRDGDVWRILRKDTFIDLIKFDFILLNKKYEDQHLIDIFNYCMKAQLIDRLKPIDISENINLTVDKFNLENSLILDTYDLIFKEIENQTHHHFSSNLHDLNNKIQYIKVGNDLNISLNLDDLFFEIMIITLVILMRQ